MRTPYIITCKKCRRLYRRPNTKTFLCSVCKGTCYPLEFKKIKKFIIVRDEEKCQICEMTREKHKFLFGKDLFVHHKDGNILNNNLNNLETRCCQCHKSKHKTNEAIHHKVIHGSFGNRLLYRLNEGTLNSSTKNYRVLKRKFL
ncbi:MAG: hypothetical protein AABY22_21610 [Nanoarchaeota archaeon]